MKFLTVEIFTVILTCMWILLITDAQNNAMGRDFLLDFACANNDPEIVLHTYMRRAFRVTLTVDSDFGMKESHVTIRKGEVGKFIVKAHKVMWQKSSLRSAVVLRGQALFGAIVQTKAEMISDRFMALPVESYGHTYLATNFGGQPFIILLSNMDGTLIRVDPVNQDAENITVCFNGVQVSFRKEVSLNRHQSFTMMECKDAENATELLTGTVLSGINPFGVISGGCWSLPDENETACLETNYEMALPADSHGQEFVVAGLSSSEVREDLIVVPHTVETTVLVIGSDGTQTYSSVRDLQGSFFTIPIFGVRFVKSDQKVTVYYVISKSCNSTSVYSPQTSITVLPTSLYFNSYHWSTFIVTNTETKLVALFIVQQDRVMELQVDGEYPQKVAWADVAGDGGWKIGSLDIEVQGFHFATNPKNFGAYALASWNETLGMSPVGLSLSYINCAKTVHVMIIGDEVDNDCDNATDEEFANNIDDDNDTLIDEDVGTKIPIEVDQGCPPFRYGPNCSMICSNCLQSCDKTTGLCKECAAGFIFGNGTCFEECPELTFGFNCTGSCMQKCQQDCLDRIHGSCSRVSETHKSSAGSVFAAFSLFVTGILFVCAMFASKQKEVKVPPPKRVVSEESIATLDEKSATSLAFEESPPPS